MEELEGVLLVPKSGGRGEQPRFFRLSSARGGVLLSGKTEAAAKGAFARKLPLRNAVHVKELQDGRWMLKTKKKEYAFRCEARGEAQAWVRAVKMYVREANGVPQPPPRPSKGEKNVESVSIMMAVLVFYVAASVIGFFTPSTPSSSTKKKNVHDEMVPIMEVANPSPSNVSSSGSFLGGFLFFVVVAVLPFVFALVIFQFQHRVGHYLKQLNVETTNFLVDLFDDLQQQAKESLNVFTDGADENVAKFQRKLAKVVNDVEDAFQALKEAIVSIFRSSSKKEKRRRFERARDEDREGSRAPIHIPERALDVEKRKELEQRLMNQFQGGPGRKEIRQLARGASSTEALAPKKLNVASESSTALAAALANRSGPPSLPPMFNNQEETKPVQVYNPRFEAPLLPGESKGNGKPKKTGKQASSRRLKERKKPEKNKKEKIRESKGIFSSKNQKEGSRRSAKRLEGKETEELAPMLLGGGGGTAGALSAKGAKFEKYAKMLRSGVPEGAVRNAMARDGVAEPKGIFDDGEALYRKGNDRSIKKQIQHARKEQNAAVARAPKRRSLGKRTDSSIIDELKVRQQSMGLFPDEDY